MGWLAICGRWRNRRSFASRPHGRRPVRGDPGSLRMTSVRFVAGLETAGPSTARPTVASLRMTSKTEQVLRFPAPRTKTRPRGPRIAQDDMSKICGWFGNSRSFDFATYGRFAQDDIKNRAGHSLPDPTDEDCPWGPRFVQDDIGKICGWFGNSRSLRPRSR